MITKFNKSSEMSQNEEINIKRKFKNLKSLFDIELRQLDTSNVGSLAPQVSLWERASPLSNTCKNEEIIKIVLP